MSAASRGLDSFNWYAPRLLLDTDADILGELGKMFDSLRSFHNCTNTFMLIYSN
jgi:hypothetical protein